MLKEFFYRIWVILCRNFGLGCLWIACLEVYFFSGGLEDVIVGNFAFVLSGCGDSVIDIIRCGTFLERYQLRLDQL